MVMQLTKTKMRLSALDVCVAPEVCLLRAGQVLLRDLQATIVSKVS